MPSMEFQECPVLEVQRCDQTHRQTFFQTIYCSPPEEGGSIIYPTHPSTIIIMYPFVCPSIHLSTHTCIDLLLNSFIHPCYLSTHPSIYPSICTIIYSFIRPVIHICIHPYIIQSQYNYIFICTFSLHLESVH